MSNKNILRDIRAFNILDRENAPHVRYAKLIQNDLMDIPSQRKMEDTLREREAPLMEWMIHEMMQINMRGVPEWIRRKLYESYKNAAISTFRSKMKRVIHLKKYDYFDPVNYICTVFRVTSAKLDTSVNYCFLYSIDLKYGHWKIPPIKKNMRSPIAEWFCMSPSLLSQDGEYRGQVLRTTQWIYATLKYNKVFKYMQRYVAKKLEHNQLTLDYENFFPQLDQEHLAENLTDLIVTYNLLTDMFVAFWLLEIYKISIGIQENHINPKFNQIFFPNVNDDMEQFIHLCKKFTVEYILEMIEELTVPYRITGEQRMSFTYHSIGQKLRPLNVGEVQRPFNIMYPPWRELFLSQYASDLTINGVSPNFGCIIGWLYIKNSKRGLFDNEQQYKKIELSERALIMTRKLIEMQHITYMKQPETKNRKIFYGPHFEEAYNRINNPLRFVRDNILMSNVTLCFMSESLGRTFFDIKSLAQSPVWLMHVGNLIRDTLSWRKYMWDICYGLLSLNVMRGMTHSDLHLNNTTIDSDGVHPLTDGRRYAVLYRVFGYWFKVPTRGPTACIIDFSRATIMPDRVRRDPNFQDLDEFQLFVDLQNSRMIAKLENLVPTFMKINRSKVVELMNLDFDIFYKIYTAVDTFDFANKMYKYFETQASRVNLALVHKIWKMSEHYLTTMLLKVIINRDLQFEWPILHILRECFAECIFDPNVEDADLVVTGVWSLEHDTPMKYSLERYASWPAYMQTPYYMLTPASKKVRLLKNMQQEHQRINFERYTKDQMDMIRYIARRHTEKYQ